METQTNDTDVRESNVVEGRLPVGLAQRWFDELINRIRSIRGNLVLRLEGKGGSTSFQIKNALGDDVLRVYDHGRVDMMNVPVHPGFWRSTRQYPPEIVFANPALYGFPGYCVLPTGVIMLRGLYYYYSSLPESVMDIFGYYSRLTYVFAIAACNSWGRLEYFEELLKIRTGVANCWFSIDGIEVFVSGVAWNSITLQNGWVAENPPYYPPEYYKDPTQVVRLRGNMSNGWNNLAAVLPSDVRPPYHEWFPAAMGTNSFVAVLVKSNGEIEVNTSQTVSLSNIRFTTRDDVWIKPELINGWQQNPYPGFAPAGYYRDPFGIVRMRGLIANGTPSETVPAFTLPPGYRPAHYHHMIAVASGNFSGNFPATVRVDTNGNVFIFPGSATWTSLSGVAFKAER